MQLSHLDRSLLHSQGNSAISRAEFTVWGGHGVSCVNFEGEKKYELWL